MNERIDAVSNRLALVFAPLFAITLVAGACSSTSAVTPPASADAGDAATGKTAWATSACGTCATGKCATVRQTCDVEPSCAAHAKCVDACGAAPSGEIDAACIAACPRGDNEVATRSRAAYDSCLQTTGPRACNECPKPPPDPTGLEDILGQQCGGSTETNACYKCEDLNCCKTYEVCANDPDCKNGVQACAKACGKDDKCIGECYAKFPKGVAPYARKLACMSVRCVTECGGTIDRCLECAVMKECRDTNTRCAADAGCFLIRQCLTETCPTITDACLDACRAKQPASAGLYDAWFSCLAVSCIDVCK